MATKYNREHEAAMNLMRVQMLQMKLELERIRAERDSLREIIERSIGENLKRSK